jgi:ankyrin repeat protein
VVRESLRSVKGKRVEGTCEWIRNNDTYQSWLHGDTHLLWISGGPGKGKTMLSIFLTEELEKDSGITTLFFFTNNQDDKRNTAITILRGLLYQIITKCPNLTKQHVLPYFETPEKTQDTLSSLETLWLIFKKLLQDPKLGPTFCVLDGLDECEEDSSRILIAKLTDFFSQQNLRSIDKSIKLVIVSRVLQDLKGTAQIRLDPDHDENVTSDIERFISTRVEELSHIEGFDEKFRVTVESTLLERADGTFLWVGFVMNELSQKKTCTEIEEALSAIPKGLDAIYDRMLLQIESDRRPTAIRILQWVTMAFRPLDLEELAVAINVQSSMSISQERAIRDYVTLCGSFIKLYENKVSFVHQSAKDYLLQKKVHNNSVVEEFRIKPEKAHLELARRCLDHIQEFSSLLDKRTISESSLETEESMSVTSSSPEYSFLMYAMENWPEHARYCASHGKELLDISLPFFQKDSSLRQKWTMCYNRRQRQRNFLFHPIPPLGLIHLASYFGIVAWVHIFLTKKKPFFRLRKRVNKKDKTKHRTPLTWAARNGQEAVVKLLIGTSKADLQTRDFQGSTPLLLAADYGHDTVVKLLLETKKVDPDCKNNDNRTPLFLAACNGHDDVVKLLIQTRRVDLNHKGVSGITPLGWAALHNREAAAALLLKQPEVNINSRTYDNRSAISLAAQEGSEAVAKLLIKAPGIELDIKDTKYGWTPLAWAADSGEAGIVKLLVDTQMVDPNLKDHEGRTPLFLAARNGFDDAVEVLLNTPDVDIECKNDYGWTPLTKAVSIGHLGVVELLLKTNRVDLDCKDDIDRTPLLLALKKQHERIAKRLLRTHKVDLDCKDSEGRTPISRAAENGMLTIVKLLLETQKVDPDCKDNEGRTPISRAAENGKLAIVKLLLETHKVDPDCQDNEGRTPLSWAAVNRGNETIIKLLLETLKVDPDCKDNNGRTPLSWAVATGGNEITVKLLLETLKVDPDCEDNKGRTPLSWAAATWGNGIIVKLLLETLKVDPDCRDNESRTPLSWAAEFGSKDIVDLLSRTHQVDPNFEDFSERPPPSWAANFNFQARSNKRAFY